MSIPGIRTDLNTAAVVRLAQAMERLARAISVLSPRRPMINHGLKGANLLERAEGLCPGEVDTQLSLSVSLTSPLAENHRLEHAVDDKVVVRSRFLKQPHLLSKRPLALVARQCRIPPAS